jgi:hypothetical protein
VAPSLTTPSPGPAVSAPPLLNSLPSITTTVPLAYHDFSHSIVHRDQQFPCNPELLEPQSDIFTYIVHPYDTTAFESFLLKHKLSHIYPLLVANLRNGFPLGVMPALTTTVILPNHISVTQHAELVHQYLSDELEAGRMSGPFSRQRVEDILRGPFFSSPFLISVQPQQPGVPDKLRVCRHLSKGNKDHASVNSHTHKELFPTRFDTAARVADTVSLFFHIQFLI